MEDKSTEETIRKLEQWRRVMKAQGFNTFIVLRSDAGTNFVSEQFKKWCENEGIKLTVAGPKHQEQNAFVESAYKTVNGMAQSMLVQARLPLSFIHLALDYYVCEILLVLPAKGLKLDDSTLVTTYELLYNKKPSVRRFKVFGCPVVFKRYQPAYDGDSTTKFMQLQQGSRGIFVGFPRNQAGWLIYVPQKINNKHLVVSMDVVFDQEFLSSIAGTSIPFSQAQPEKVIGKVGGPPLTSTESTGNITNLIEGSITHWGNEETYDTTLNYSISSSAPINIPSDSRERDSDDESSVHSQTSTSTFESETSALVPLGSQTVHGHRYSTRIRSNQQSNSAVHTCLEMNKIDHMVEAFNDNEAVFVTLETAANQSDIPLTPYLSEPRSLKDIQLLPPEIQRNWIAAAKKEFKFIIKNGTLDGGVNQYRWETK